MLWHLVPQADIRRDGHGILEQIVGPLKVARHNVPALPGFKVGGHQTCPCRKVLPSCQGLNGRDRSIGGILA